MKVLIDEYIPKTIQGEGIDLGLPFQFLRLGGCNLRCQWCDAWSSSWGDGTNWIKKNIEQVIADIVKNPINNVCITGGEPLIYKHLVHLCQQLKSYGKYINIQTNGTIFIPELIPFVDLFSVSPKLSSSIPVESEFKSIHEAKRIQIDVLKQFNTVNTEFKFVIDNDTDFNEMMEIVRYCTLTKPVVITPVGDECVNNPILYLEKVQWLVNITQQNQFNCRVNPQFHKLVWLGIKGGI